MKKYVLNNNGLKLVIGWLMIAVSPMLVLFWKYIITNNVLTTQLNSFFVSSVFVVITHLSLNKFTRFPGQQSTLMVLPIVITVSMILGIVILLFHLPYSVYYLTASLVIAIFFYLVLHTWLPLVYEPVIAYVPLGRCESLVDIKGIKWLKMNDNISLSNDISKYYSFVVADLADNSMNDKWEKILAEITLQGVPVYNVLQVRESLTGRMPIKHLYENNLGSLLPSSVYLWVKRILDLFVILVSMPIVLPIAILVAIAVKFEGRHTNAPIIFMQERVGQGGKMFTMYKFRSMVPTSESEGAKMAIANDVRITKFGHFIRKFRLDELPQFVNVLKGEMSLIGPRPEQPNFVEQFNDSIPFYRYRHIVKPGISGWAQVTHGYASDEDETRVKLEHDFYYIKNFSLTLDLLIVIKTIQTMLTGFGAR